MIVTGDKCHDALDMFLWKRAGQQCREQALNQQTGSGSIAVMNFIPICSACAINGLSSSSPCCAIAAFIAGASSSRIQPDD